MVAIALLDSFFVYLPRVMVHHTHVEWNNDHSTFNQKETLEKTFFHQKHYIGIGSLLSQIQTAWDPNSESNELRLET